ncbi:MAG TPA: IPT/TIG domain-containing protein [Patescibacteria group bacterium]
MRLSRKSLYAIIGIIVLLFVVAIYRGYQINADVATKNVAISEVTPTSGPTGTEILIRGEGMLTNENTVTIGDKTVTGLTSDDGTSLLFYVPGDLTAGSYTLAVKNSLGQSNTSTFTVTAQ